MPVVVCGWLLQDWEHEQVVRFVLYGDRKVLIGGGYRVLIVQQQTSEQCVPHAQRERLQWGEQQLPMGMQRGLPEACGEWAIDVRIMLERGLQGGRDVDGEQRADAVQAMQCVWERGVPEHGVHNDAEQAMRGV